MFEGKIAKKLGGSLFPEEDLKKMVHTHAFCAALVIGLPLFGFDWIAFVVILWHMYSKLAERAGKEFGCGSIILGMIVNIVFVIIYDSLTSFIPVLGWITSAGLCYLQFYTSGKAYIETLKRM
ncbi:MAG: hypothetical protein K6E86_06935 [Bacteroidales bacterium]|nr:hypothetical protein [Bacteroidales bacterium]